ncbi:MAG: tRNA (adenosine(37)-N6)-dimethylallyltransferase MiaA [Oscillospiraceae bacterium]|nr:tRNA (adenosine(37)-N6)-dimethylallyltransferase MiaA [Oscillospiraceae bacterium]
MADKVIVIAGPTASGKTGLSIELAKLYNGEIVSADSMQIYRRMDIGTAKATKEEQARVPHHMIDVAEPDEDYSVSRYVEEAEKCCRDIISRGKTPIICGGTGLYIDSLLSGRIFAQRDEDSSIREELNLEYDEIGGGEMLKKLSLVDPERAEKLHPSDKRRIVRALEIFKLTGMTISEHDAATKALPRRFDSKTIVLNFKDRQDLYDRINLRVDLMAELGLFEEVSSLLESGLDDNCTAMQAIGYKEIVAALRGEISREEALEQIKMGSRRYAKRQLTWFRRSEDALWINWDKEPDVASALEEIKAFIG